MDLTQLANLGEFVGGIAVLVTLIYLALQTRQTRAAAQESARLAAVEGTYASTMSYGHWRGLVLGDPELADLIAKANQDETLSEGERIRLSLVFEQLFVIGLTGDASSRSQGTLHSSTIDLDYVVAFLQQNPSGLPDWHRFKGIVHSLAPDYVSAVDRRLGEAGV